MAAIRLAIHRERFTAEIVGRQPKFGNPASEHVGPTNVILRVEGVIYESGVMIGRVRDCMWPNGNSVVKPALNAGDDRLRKIGIDIAFGKSSG
jgi:hypothetical protein